MVLALWCVHGVRERGGGMVDLGDAQHTPLVPVSIFQPHICVIALL